MADPPLPPAPTLLPPVPPEPPDWPDRSQTSANQPERQPPVHSPASHKFQRIVKFTSLVQLTYPVICILLILAGSQATGNGFASLLCGAICMVGPHLAVAYFSLYALEKDTLTLSRRWVLVRRGLLLILAPAQLWLQGAFAVEMIDDHDAVLWFGLVSLVPLLNSLAFLIGWVGYSITTPLPRRTGLRKEDYETGIDDTHRGGDWDEAREKPPELPH